MITNINNSIPIKKLKKLKNLRGYNLFILRKTVLFSTTNVIV